MSSYLRSGGRDKRRGETPTAFAPDVAIDDIRAYPRDAIARATKGLAPCEDRPQVPSTWWNDTIEAGPDYSYTHMLMSPWL